MVSPSYEQSQLLQRGEHGWTMCHGFGAPRALEPHTGTFYLTLTQQKKYNNIFSSRLWALEVSFKSPFAGDPLEDCLATKAIAFPTLLRYNFI